MKKVLSLLAISVFSLSAYAATNIETEETQISECMPWNWPCPDEK